MKILFLTPQLPFPPQQGTTIRNFNIIKELAPRHEVHILSFGSREELEGSPLCELVPRIELVPPPTRRLLQRVLETVSSPLPDMAKRLDSFRLVDKLGEMVRDGNYSVVQIEGIEMAGAWLTAAAMVGQREGEGSGRAPRTVVFDDHNAEYILQKTAFESDRMRIDRLHGAFYSYIQWHKLENFERRVCLAATSVAAVSETDAGALTSLDPRISPVVIPNGVDIHHYLPSDKVCAKPLAELSVVFTGKMDFRPNVDAAIWFVKEILPRLRRTVPLAHITIVGQRPSAAVQALSARPGVEVTGRVPDPRPYIADAAVYVVPLRMGGGTRLKVLEAMAMGKAIVSTTLGAEGIKAEPGRDLILADTPEDFAQAVIQLMRDLELRIELGKNGRRLVESQYDWRKLVPRFEVIYGMAS